VSAIVNRSVSVIRSSVFRRQRYLAALENSRAARRVKPHLAELDDVHDMTIENVLFAEQVEKRPSG